MTFNLVDEPWIPCVMLNGERIELGLERVLVEAHRIREVHDPSPLVTVALHRLLLAVLHRVFGPRRSGDWIPLWQRGAWEPEPIRAYLRAWRHRFDLFHPERPFGQVPYMEDARVAPIAALLLEAASGNNATLFDHGRVEGEEEVAPGRAACYLLAYQAFAIGFGKSKPFYLKDAPLTRGLTVMACGDTLFETLALNLMPEDRWQDAFPQSPDDAPFWERDDLPEPNPEGTWPLGRTDYLTWQSRRIHLIGEGSPPRVRSCQIQQRYCLPGQAIRWDPFKPYLRDAQRGFVPLNLDAAKAAWRDCHTLLQLGDDAARRGARPELLNWLAEIEERRQSAEIDARPQYHLMIVGLTTARGKAASVELWRRERLPLPLAYLRNTELLQWLSFGLETAGAVGSALRAAIWFLAKQVVSADQPDGQPRAQDDIDRLAQHLSVESVFWPRLEPPFTEFLLALPDDAPDGALENWLSRLRASAWEAFRHACESLTPSARVMKAVVQTERYFRFRLASALEGKGMDESA